MTAVKDKSKAAADQMNIAAKNAEQAVRCVHGYFLLLSLPNYSDKISLVFNFDFKVLCF